MAQSIKTEPKASSDNKHTAAEMQAWFEQNKDRIQRYEEASDAVRLVRDVTKTSRQRTVSSYNKKSILTWIQNPSSNEINLRNVSRYLFYRSAIYHKLVLYNATMFDLNCRSIIPNYDLTKTNNTNKMIKSYYETAKQIDVMDLQTQLLPCYITNFIEDVSYNCVWIDETGMFILNLPPEYCRISGKYMTGDYAFSVDMTYFNKFPELLEYLGDPIQSMYDAYINEKQKWQPMKDENCLCLKKNMESFETIVPPFASLFAELVTLEDLKDIQATADELQIYKLLVATIPTITGSNEPDDFAVNPKLAVDYFNRMVESLPDYVGAAISPLPIESISFSDNDVTNDTTKVEKATQSVLNTSGGAQVLNSASISTGTAFQMAMKVDTEMAISGLLGQTQAWLNRMLTYLISDPCRVKFFEVSAYTKEALKESMQKDLNYGYPNVLAINTLNGYSELETLSLNFFEKDVLGLSDRFQVLQTSSTQSANSEAATEEGGAPVKSDTEIGDQGIKARDNK